jgi:hypothetical protein
LEKIAALYLAHLNPVTRAHETIISNLSRDYNVYVYPVIFLKNNKEINTRTFPFPFEIRKVMLEGLTSRLDNVKILPDYFFESPYVKYLPPFISPYSWTLRKQILRNVKEKEFISYTGDFAERVALNFYNLHPKKSKRLQISASKVKELIYEEALGKGTSDNNGRQTQTGEGNSLWKNLVSDHVASIILRNWNIVERFARIKDRTVKIMGMKFPADGILHC